MATTTRPKWGTLDTLGMIAFLVGTAVLILVSAKAGIRVFGFWMIAGAVLQQLSGQGVPYGWEARPPSGYLTGRLGFCLNGAMALVGLCMVIWPSIALGLAGWDAE